MCESSQNTNRQNIVSAITSRKYMTAYFQSTFLESSCCSGSALWIGSKANPICRASSQQKRQVFLKDLSGTNLCGFMRRLDSAGCICPCIGFAMPFFYLCELILIPSILTPNTPYLRVKTLCRED